MARCEYIKISIRLVQDQIIKKYNLEGMEHNEYVYYEIKPVMYGLPQAGIIAKHFITQHLESHRYYHTRHTLVLWKHKWRHIMFSLMVDNF